MTYYGERLRSKTSKGRGTAVGMGGPGGDQGKAPALWSHSGLATSCADTREISPEGAPHTW